MTQSAYQCTRRACDKSILKGLKALVAYSTTGDGL